MKSVATDVNPHLHKPADQPLFPGKVGQLVGEGVDAFVSGLQPARWRGSSLPQAI